MRGRITLIVEVPDNEALTELCSVVKDVVPGHMYSAEAALLEAEWTVIGSLDQGAFVEVVYAVDAAEATEKALADEPERTIVAVIPGSNQTVIDSVAEQGS